VYDALNRVTSRIVPQVTYSSSNCHYLNGFSCGYTFPTFEGSSLCIAVDTARFGYDVGGNVRAADHNWARVRRAYAPSGAVLYDTLVVRRYETDAPGPCGGGDRHALGESAFGSDWSAHVYALRSEYDLAGRRTKLHHPNQLDPCAGVSCQQRYGYNDGAGVGTLDTLVHPDTSGASLTMRFTHDNQLRLLNSVHPGAVIIARTYDADGRLTARSGSLTLDGLAYEATGRVVGGTVKHPATQATDSLLWTTGHSADDQPTLSLYRFK
jgi:YD repeat-containing protein